MRAYEILREETKIKQIDSTIMQSIITPALEKLYSIYKKNGYDLRIVGGAVRDILLGKKPKDIDLATDATPIESMEILKKNNIKLIETGLKHGTITAIINGEHYEITTLRIDTEHTGRHATVKFTKDWKQDAERRDLTFNAMSLDLNGTLYDYFGGINDLKNEKSKFVGDPNKRIQEDYLRILRYFRFQGRINNPKWDKETLKAILNNANNLKQISGERIWMEMSKILSGKNVNKILQKMHDTQVLKNIGLEKINLNEFHRVEKLTSDPILRLASLLNNENNVDNISKKWKLSIYERELLRFIILNRNKIFNEIEAMKMWTNNKIKDEFILKLAEYLGKKNIIKKLTNQIKPKFPVNGQDLINVGIKPGPKLGNILDILLNHWRDTGYKLSKDDLLKWGENNEIL